MPRGDRTGPMGMGPMTGRAAGFCAGNGAPGYTNPVPGRGFGMGRGGRGRGFRHWFYATGLPGWLRFGGIAAPNQQYDPEMEKQAIKNQADLLQSELDSVKQRLSALEKEKVV
ncbi:MAG: DUF5320 domain-containing protein [Candidatus Neomarinimicrobiota bacterium]